MIREWTRIHRSLLTSAKYISLPSDAAGVLYVHALLLAENDGQIEPELLYRLGWAPFQKYPKRANFKKLLQRLLDVGLVLPVGKTLHLYRFEELAGVDSKQGNASRFGRGNTSRRRGKHFPPEGTHGEHMGNKGGKGGEMVPSTPIVPQRLSPPRLDLEREREKEQSRPPSGGVFSHSNPGPKPTPKTVQEDNPTTPPKPTLRDQVFATLEPAVEAGQIPLTYAEQIMGAAMRYQKLKDQKREHWHPESVLIAVKACIKHYDELEPPSPWSYLTTVAERQHVAVSEDKEAAYGKESGNISMVDVIDALQASGAPIPFESLDDDSEGAEHEQGLDHEKPQTARGSSE